MGEAVLYLVINLLMLRFLTFTPIFPPFTASSIDYQLTVINIYWTATLLRSCQICIQPKLQERYVSPRLSVQHIYICERHVKRTVHPSSFYHPDVVLKLYDIYIYTGCFHAIKVYGDHQLSSPKNDWNKLKKLVIIHECFYDAFILKAVSVNNVLALHDGEQSLIFLQAFVNLRNIMSKVKLKRIDNSLPTLLLLLLLLLHIVIHLLLYAYYYTCIIIIITF